jgi:hypothetical protein
MYEPLEWEKLFHKTILNFISSLYGHLPFSSGVEEER